MMRITRRTPIAVRPRTLWTACASDRLHLRLTRFGVIV